MHNNHTSQTPITAMTPLRQLTDDHNFLVQAAAEAVGMQNPIAFEPSGFQYPLLDNSIRGALVPISGVLIRDWGRHWPKFYPGIHFGARHYTTKGIRFIRITAQSHGDLPHSTYDFFVVDQADYAQLFRLANEYQRTSKPAGLPPVLTPEIFATLRQNTLDFLNPKSLKRIKDLGGRPKRGLLLTGPPGNGKTSACRWILEQCTTLGYETKQVSPDDYRAARTGCNPAAAVKELFSVTSRGVVFFDDMDLALRNRDAAEQPEDQAVFLGAMDGIDVHEGVVYIFTTNLPIERIDPAFKRPGRIDLVLPFPKPNAVLRRVLIDRWHADVRAGIADLDMIVSDTEDYSFAEIEELKNLLVLRFLDVGAWDWNWARQQFATFRQDLATTRNKAIGFGTVTNTNGHLAMAN